MNRSRWKNVERKVAATLNDVLSGVGNLTPLERIPLLGREGPDLTINETGLVINVKSRGRIPQRLFPRKNELIFIQAFVCFRLDALVEVADKKWIHSAWTPAKPCKELSDWWLWMDKWTKEYQPTGITAIIIHRPRMPIGHAGVVIHQNDLRRLSCQIKTH